MQNYHNHKFYSNILVADCPTSYESYVSRAIELGHNVISSVEHGFQSNYYIPYELVENHNNKLKNKLEQGEITQEEYNKKRLKFIFGAEAYWVKDRLKEYPNGINEKTGEEKYAKDRTNCHIVLLAKNEEGRRDINEALSDANIDGYYGQPRLDMELLLRIKPENVFVTTACLKYWVYEDIEEITVKLHNHFKYNFYFEVQCHNTKIQKDINKRILNLSKKYGIDIIFGYDSHYIYEEDSIERNNYLEGRGMKYDEDEVGWYMDYPDDETVVNRLMQQGVLSEEEIDRCMKNTDKLLCFDDLYFDKDIKLPPIYPEHTQEWRNNKLRDLVYEKWEKEKIHVHPSRYKEYEEGIEYELDAIFETKMTDYFLIDYEIVKKGVEKGGIVTKSGRGCFTKDSLVYTRKTLKKICDVVVGDEVVDLNGNFKKVVDTMKYDIDEELVQIKHIYGTDTHYPTICTKDHKILIYRNGKTDWIEAQNIDNSIDYVCVPKPNVIENTLEFIDLNTYNTFGFEFDDQYIYEYNPYKNNAYPFSPTEVAKKISIGKSSVEKLVNGITEDFPRKQDKMRELLDYVPFESVEQYRKYIKEKRTTRISRYIKNDYMFNQFIGLLYGDGFNCEKKITVGLAINTETCKDKINKNIFYNIAKRVGLDVYSNKSRNKKLEQISVNSKIFSEFVSSELFISKKDRHKQFNEKYFNESICNQEGILNGLFLSDGSDSENRISFDNTSLPLINAYKILSMNTRYGINSLSIRLGHVDNKGYNNKESYKLRKPSNMFNSQKTKERCLEDEFYWYLPIKEIIFLPKQKTTVYDMTIEDSHSYLINNMVVHNSAVSYYSNSLLGFSDIDRFISPVRLYPDRFMSKTRILLTKSLPDIDINLGTVEPFVEAQSEVMGAGHSYPMISYKPLQKSSAFKLYAKSQGLNYEFANEITSQIKQYEKDIKHADSQEERDEIDLYDYVEKKYHCYLDESKKYQGIINAKSQAPSAYLIYSGDIKREIGLIKCKSETTHKEVLTTVIDGAVAENYKFVKNDLLKVTVWLTINKIFNMINKPVYSVREITKIVENDQKTWQVYENGYTLGINQCESQFGRQCCKRYKPKNMQELTALVSALRPGFKTQLDNFLDRKPYTSGVKELDLLLEDSFHYIMYQENIMTYLGWLGIEQTETYDIIKKISKKKFKEKELTELKSRLVKQWFINTGKEEGFEDTWKIVEAFAKYAFNASHAYSYAYDSVYGAYLKSHYPYEFYSVMLQSLSEKGDKDKVAAYKVEMKEAFGISDGVYKFRKDNRLFSIDKEMNCINPSIVSIKNFSQSIADELYSLKDCNCDNFVDLLLMFKEKTSVGVSRLEDLIKINYFSEFGNIKKLLRILKVFVKVYDTTKKTFKKQISKDKVDSYAVTEELVKAFSHKQTDKTYMMVDMYGMLKELNSIDFSDVSVLEKITFQHEVLNTIDIIDRKQKGVAYVLSVDTKYAPKLECYALANGNNIEVKIDRRTFSKNPLKEKDIILIKNIIPKERQIMGEDGEYTPIKGTKVWWVTDYRKVSA